LRVDTAGVLGGGSHIASCFHQHKRLVVISCTLPVIRGLMLGRLAQRQQQQLLIREIYLHLFRRARSTVDRYAITCTGRPT